MFVCFSIEFIRSKLTFFSVHVSGVLEAGARTARSVTAGVPARRGLYLGTGWGQPVTDTIGA